MNNIYRILILAFVYVIADLCLLNFEILYIYHTRNLVFILSILIIAYCISSILFKSSLNQTLDLRYLKVFRISYSLICIITCLQHFSLIEHELESYNIIHKLTPLNAHININFISYILSIIYLNSLLLLLANINPQLQFLILFITGGFVIPFSLEIFLKTIINFSCLLISNNAWKTKKYSSFDCSAIFLMGICLTTISSFAGLYKALDPVWLNSLGLYYSLNIPYLMPKPLWFFLEYEILIKFLNWIVIIGEISALPFFIYHKTRSFALIILFSLGLFLTVFMANIGLVGGPTILASCILLLSCKYNSEKKEVISL